MAEKKIIAVVGATAAQGRGIARAILQRSQQRVYRTSPDARRPLVQGAGAGQVGAQLVTADIDGTESMKKAFEGAYCVTFYGRAAWSSPTP